MACFLTGWKLTGCSIDIGATDPVTDPLNSKFANYLRPPCSACGRPLILTRIQPDERPGFDLRVYYCAACGMSATVIGPVNTGSLSTMIAGKGLSADVGSDNQT
jgi:hypothetical protein